MLKVSVKKVKNTIFISIFLCHLSYSQIAFFPFANSSSYEGNWNIEFGVPDFCAAYLREMSSYNVYSSKTVSSLFPEKYRSSLAQPDIEYVKDLLSPQGFQYIFLGEIRTLSISRSIAGEPTLAGYESYSCEISALVRCINLHSGIVVFNEEITTSLSRSGLGIQLFGKPTEDKSEFYGLDKISFGSEEFSSTLVGETLHSFAEDFHRKINTKIVVNSPDSSFSTFSTNDPALDSIKIHIYSLRGEIIKYDPLLGEAFVNVGKNHGVKVGEKLAIFTEGDKLVDSESGETLGFDDKIISFLEIVDIRGPRLSLGIVTNRRNEITKGMKVKRINH